MATTIKFFGVLFGLLIMAASQPIMAQDLDYTEANDEALIEESNEPAAETEEFVESVETDSSDDY